MSLIDDINKASGKKPKAPGFIKAVKGTKLKDVGIAVLLSSIIVLGVKWWQSKDEPTPIIDTPIIDTIEKEISKPLPPPEPEIIYRDSPQLKAKYNNLKVKYEKLQKDYASKPKYRYKESPELQRKYNELMIMYARKPKIEYRWRYRDHPDLKRKQLELEAIYRRRARMLDKFYAIELKPGESQRLTFESSCPGFNNSLAPVQKYRQKLN